MIPVARRLFWSCHICGHPVSGMSEAAIQGAMNDHAERVNLTVNRATDPHFELVRLDQLVQA